MSKVELDKLLVSYKKGNDEAFEKVYLMTKDGVFSLVYSVLRNYQAAEDVVMTTYLKISDNISSYKDGTNAQAWILTIAKNLALNEYNKRKRETQIDFDDESYKHEKVYMQEYENAPILSLVDEILNDDEREIVLLKIIGKYKHKEISQILNKPIGTVLWSYNNAIKKLKKEIDSKNIVL